MARDASPTITLSKIREVTFPGKSRSIFADEDSDVWVRTQASERTSAVGRAEWSGCLNSDRSKSNDRLNCSQSSLCTLFLFCLRRKSRIVFLRMREHASFFFSHLQCFRNDSSNKLKILIPQIYSSFVYCCSSNPKIRIVIFFFFFFFTKTAFLK